MTLCSHEDLEAIALEQLSRTERLRVLEHVRGCSECGRGLAWLRAERRVFVERECRELRAAPTFDDFLSYREARSRMPASAAQVATPPRRVAWLTWSTSAVAAAACIAIFVPRSEPELSTPPAKPEPAPLIAAEPGPSTPLTPAAFTEPDEPGEAACSAPPAASPFSAAARAVEAEPKGESCSENLAVSYASDAVCSASCK